ncbi:MAG: hypothetical protein WBD41_16920 [Rhodococcus sp. (in: high G+C Gram-positive bacteria)]|uniref:Uncharacterized protein n=1 Tax=Rhodococcus baikonurensis TaxID=172041 RepID=A0ABV5XAU6_9NOCA|nr:hypothetical protein [Rhodococcus sp. KRD162]
MKKVYARIITSGSVGGLNWWPTSEDRTAVVPADPQDWADLDVTLPSRFNPITDAGAVTDFLDDDDQLGPMEAAAAAGDTTIDFGNR